ncbi:hypothetical protein L202_02125 [Cryptococcus amylolentus CBS 6039]|uniref:Uncharacterized protein n=2 Tax=Cryptococcus amylolentus TaxID=104669 RepID=A0A1E3HZG6_9TREE|nr:hypothetical protein L202_02125 [Cryptococcus amylolentus CBS 6039]ODN81734.1 hypothetical protein L202_02125 [Cryptococcus amylolentus CBS 6039]ODO10068.1 hypothetical protein I350_02294 [Cryptococcus amylolentus CBS 6273]
MLTFSNLLILALAIFALLSSTLAAPIEHEPEILQPKSFITQESNAYPPLRFLTRFRSHIPPDTKVQLEWTGGSGEGVEVYYIPQWPGQEDYAPIDILPPTKDTTRYVWHTPSQNAYPEGTTFIVGINDVIPSIGAVWYDITGLLSFKK